MGCELAARWAAAVAVDGAKGWPTGGLRGGGLGCGQGCHAAHPAQWGGDIAFIQMNIYVP